MSTIDKIKRTVLVAFGFGLATYLIISGLAILDKDNNDKNISKIVESK